MRRTGRRPAGAKTHLTAWGKVPSLCAVRAREPLPSRFHCSPLVGTDTAHNAAMPPHDDEPTNSAGLQKILGRVSALTFDGAFAALMDGDPLALTRRAAQACIDVARWVPVEVVVRRTARALARALSAGERVLPQGPDAAEAWVEDHVRRAVEEGASPWRASEQVEREHWQRHVERVAARLGVEPHLGQRAIEQFDLLPFDLRSHILRALEAVQARRTGDLSVEAWARFDAAWRRLVRAVLSEGD